MKKFILTILLISMIQAADFIPANSDTQWNYLFS